MVSSIHDSAAIARPTTEHAGAQGASQSAEQFARHMGSQEPPAPPPPAKKEDPVAPVTFQGHERLYDTLVQNRADKIPSFIPRPIRKAAATGWVRLASGGSKSRIEGNQMKRFAASRPAPSTHLPVNASQQTRSENIEHRAHTSAVAAIRNGSTAEQAIQEFGVKNLANQKALRKFEAGDINETSVLRPNMPVVEDKEETSPTQPKAGSQRPATPAPASPSHAPAPAESATASQPSSASGPGPEPSSPNSLAAQPASSPGASSANSASFPEFAATHSPQSAAAELFRMSGG